jgi:hypothetical protein
MKFDEQSLDDATLVTDTTPKRRGRPRKTNPEKTNSITNTDIQITNETVKNTITNKKNSPDIDLITKLKERYDNNLQKGVNDKSLKERIEDNPLFRLSIENYENMCKDESIKVIIAKALNIDIRSLTAFCKHIQIFKDNIDSSPNTIKEKRMKHKQVYQIQLHI